ncbi:DUF6434 domain-containing protein [Enterococcus malodoratus]|uniref:DUF6434 domain-containing protein n=1 Tax=Enterococcus malodoratus TaxID=71451 RepID=UPI003FD44B03
MTENRPRLQAGLAPEVFSEYYYLKAELQEFCQEQGLAKSGSKADLNQRITRYLRTGERLASNSSEKKVFREEYLTLDSLIEQGIVFSEKHRAFFKSELGDTFVFKVAFQNWIKENAGKTYREAIAIYPEIAAKNRKKLIHSLRTIRIFVIFLRITEEDHCKRGSPAGNTKKHCRAVINIMHRI